MEFWGVEVKSGELLNVSPDDGKVLHLSQASIGEVKKDKGNETINLFVTVEDKKMVLGTLFSDKLPQQQFDLVFDKGFELSHNWKAGSVYFYGYKAIIPEEDEIEDDDELAGSPEGFPKGFDTKVSDSDEFEEEDIPVIANNGKTETKAKKEKPAPAEKANAGKDSAAGKQKVKIVEPSKDEKPDEDDEDDSEDDESDDDLGSEDDMDEDEVEDESDSEEDESDEDEETPKKVETGKKRAAESATKTPVPDKKAKISTPQKTDGKKGGGHVATPHPSKQVGKTPANKSNNQQTPKSGGSFSCGSCKKTFGSENALQSHSKAKHSGGK